ncbi:hypothetical protein LTR10_023064 [Elasticomyces elasticus]|uniref:Restriction endonuclease domain-containing protein n=1 Tax=Exophiala sideris TaxID=1016849 RepID=A0ABR0IVG0_9EURO|nr:hypothetical protein LTR10_023064 [Elasticomyces elasticus]KAK5021091.1 hypothetical protein LTS07_011244 [Exophiala sideris]KAK5023289.1 hypothetical protein LTR13_011279 [Exophiala sideris]KAK5048802.1 hypothetical protein LTR69_011265 [Exophiala sideris]KAK5176261.1 hypothetical protein LTR44_011192 [Eurotiomycetes sp. CCFEE 6388]
MEKTSSGGSTSMDPHSTPTHGCSAWSSQDMSNYPQTEETQLQDIAGDFTAFSTCSRSLRSNYRLSPDEFRQFVKYSENKPWNKIRYDYFADTQRLVPRMPSKKHEYISTHLMFLLYSTIEQLCVQYQVKCPFSILGSADVKDGRSVRQPDSSIYHVDTRVPVLVLELGHTQSTKSLKEKAEAYIRTGRGKIRYVFTLKLDRDSQAVYLATWTPQFVREGESTVLKAKAAYQITPGSSLPKFLRQQTVMISVEELCKIVKGGEDFELSIPEADFEDIPTDFMIDSSPASSTSSESDQERESGDDKATADENDFLPRNNRSCTSHRSPIKTRARLSTKPG